MIDLLIIPVAAICNRFRGGGVIDRDIPARKLISGAVLAITVFALAKPSNFTKLESFYIPVIILSGWYLKNIIGTGRLFNAIHGWTAPKWQGVVYGSFRGLLTLFTTIPLAWVVGNWFLVLWGLLGALQGGIYYLAGKFKVKNTVAVAEYLDGALYGGIIWVLLN